MDNKNVLIDNEYVLIDNNFKMFLLAYKTCTIIFSGNEHIFMNN